MKFNEFLNKYKDEALKVDLKKDIGVYEALELNKMKLNSVTFENEIDNLIVLFEEAVTSIKPLLNKALYNYPNSKNNPYFLIELKCYFEYLELYNKATDIKKQFQHRQQKTFDIDEVKKEFKDFFNSDISVNVIEKIQKEFKDYKGKKMAHLIYLLHKDFKIINYSLNSRNESRKHFVSLLKGTDFRMAGIDRYFELSDVKLGNPKFEIDPDYIDIKEKLLKTIK